MEITTIISRYRNRKLLPFTKLGKVNIPTLKIHPDIIKVMTEGSIFAALYDEKEVVRMMIELDDVGEGVYLVSSIAYPASDNIVAPAIEASSNWLDHFFAQSPNIQAVGFDASLPFLPDHARYTLINDSESGSVIAFRPAGAVH